MDSDGLPLIGPSVDYRKVEPMNQKKTVEYLNHFIVHTAGFLNRFSTVCEEKLATLSLRVERLNTQMTLLEGKINSIPGLENVTAASTATAPPSSVSTPTSAVTTEPATQPSQNHEQTAPTPHTVVESEPPADPTNTVATHPAYAQFFKMLAVGIPAMAVKQKMTIQGLNPDLLDTPSAPVPGGGATVQSSNAQPDSSEEDISEDSDDESITFSD